MKHTPTPWAVQKSHDSRYYPWHIVYQADKSELPPIIADVKTKEAAERIVACVNAFEGIEDPEHYMDATKDIAKERIKELAELRQQCNTLHEQLDEALAEIKRLKQHQHDKLMEHPSYSSHENKTGIHRY